MSVNDRIIITKGAIQQFQDPLPNEMCAEGFRALKQLEATPARVSIKTPKPIQIALAEAWGENGIKAIEIARPRALVP